MKLITRDTDYAVRALCFIAGHKDKTVSVSELVEELKIPRAFLRKILQILHRHKLLEAHRGKGGGFVAHAPPEKIFLVDLMRIFQGVLQMNECTLKKKLCPNRNDCILRKKIALIEKHAVSELEDITIKSLLKG